MVERESLARHGSMCLFIPDRAQETEAGGISVSLNPAWYIHSEFQDSQSSIKRLCLKKQKQERKKDEGRVSGREGGRERVGSLLSK